MTTQQPRAQERRHRILDAALRTFSRRGYRDTSVDEIAEGSRTSKGGVYFHFPNKEAIFLALLNRSTAHLLERIETAMAAQEDPIAKADAALLTVLRTFANHRALARLFMLEALGAGREFHQRMSEIRSEFAAIIQRQLDDAVRQGILQPLDTEVAGRAWFGALAEITTNWVFSGQPERLEDAFTALRPLLMRSVGLTSNSHLEIRQR